MDAYTIQSGSGQDYSGYATVDNVSYCFVFDGHGRNDCIEYIRTLDMNHFATLPCPPTALEESFLGKNFYKSGSTFVLARITQHLHKNTLEVFHVGDAKAKVFLNHTLLHETNDHTFQNNDEILRTKHFVRIQPSKAPFPVSDHEVQMIDSSIGHFQNGEAFVPSQALGHNGISGLLPGHFTLEFDPFDHIRVVCGSDGFWDMLPPTNGRAKDLALEAVRRWKQFWKFGDVTTTYGDIDDVSVAILDNTHLSSTICIPYSLNCFTTQHVRNSFPFDIHSIDEAIVDDHKVFFLHFNSPCHGLRLLFKNIRDRQVKLYYNDTWFWHLKLRDNSLLEHDSIDIHDYIPHISRSKINLFLSMTNR